MSLSNKDIVSMDRYAASMDAYTKAVGSEAGQDLRKERLALEKASGGAKRLEEAEAVLSKAKTEAEGILAAARNEAAGITHDAIDEINERKGDLDLRDASLGSKIETNDSRQKQLEKDETAVKERARQATLRETAVTAREDTANVEATRLAAWETALNVRDRDLEAWAARMQSASVA